MSESLVDSAIIKLQQGIKRKVSMKPRENSKALADKPKVDEQED